LTTKLDLGGADSLKKMQSEIIHHSQYLETGLDMEPEQFYELQGELSTHDYLHHANSDFL